MMRDRVRVVFTLLAIVATVQLLLVNVGVAASDAPDVNYEQEDNIPTPTKWNVLRSEMPNPYMYKTESGRTVCNLRCWLAKLKVTMDERLDLNILGTYITGLVFNQFMLGSVGATFYPDTKATTGTGVQIKITGLNAHLEGQFHYWALWWQTAKLTATTTGSGATLTFSFVKGKDGLVERVDFPTSACQLNIVITELNLGWMDATDAMLSMTRTLITNMVTKKVCPLLQDLVQTNVTGLMTKVNNIIRPFMNVTKPTHVPISAEIYSSLQTSPVVDMARYVFTELTGIEGPLNINHIMDILSGGDGILSLSDFYNGSIAFSIPVLDMGIIDASLLDLKLSYLNTWKYLDILNPVTEFLLDGHTAMSKLGIDVKFGIGVTLLNSSMITAGGEYLYEEAGLTLYTEDSDLQGQLQLAWYKGLIGTYTNIMCMNVTCVGAVLDSESTAITQAFFNTTIKKLAMINATGDLEADVHQTLDLVVKLFLDNYVGAISPFFNGVIATKGVELANGLISKYINSSCDHAEDPVTAQVNAAATSASFSGAGAAFGAMAVIPLYSRLGSFRKKRKSSKKPNSTEAGVVAAGAGATEDSSESEEEDDEDNEDPKYALGCTCAGEGRAMWFIKQWVRTDKYGCSLLMDHRVNLITRFLVPLATLVAIALFITSNTGVGASVYVKLAFGSGKVVMINDLFSFGLTDTISDMWTAGVYPLSILVAVMSGFWPYCKLILLMLTWIVPTSIIPERWRERVLMLLDALGKWSLLDTYVMVMMLVAFHFKIVFPLVDPADVDKPVRIDVYINAAFGFVTFLIATVLSLLTSHVALFFHRLIKVRPDENDCPEAHRWRCLIAVWKIEFIEKISPVLMWVLRAFITVLLIITFVLVVLGVTFLSFSFDFKGLAGWALELLGISSHREYSVITLGNAMPGAAEHPNAFNIRVTQILYVLTAYVLPFIFLGNLLFLWLVPLNRRLQKYVFTVAEILNAWTCLDVFVISIIAAIMEISQFAAFMVGDKCDFIQPYIGKYFGADLGGHDTCFEVVAKLQSGCWLLFFSCLLLVVTSQVILRAAHKALDDRAKPVEEKKKKEPPTPGMPYVYDPASTMGSPTPGLPMPQPTTEISPSSMQTMMLPTSGLYNMPFHDSLVPPPADIPMSAVSTASRGRLPSSHFYSRPLPPMPPQQMAPQSTMMMPMMAPPTGAAAGINVGAIPSLMSDGEMESAELDIGHMVPPPASLSSQMTPAYTANADQLEPAADDLNSLYSGRRASSPAYSASVVSVTGGSCIPAALQPLSSATASTQKKRPPPPPPPRGRSSVGLLSSTSNNH